MDRILKYFIIMTGIVLTAWLVGIIVIEVVTILYPHGVCK